MAAPEKRILEIGNWPPPVCGWSMNLVDLRRELDARGWDCQVMNLNENRRVRSSEYIDVQNGRDYLWKVMRHVWRGYAVHVRVNGETKKGYFLALGALLLARLLHRPALLTYAGGHRQSYFPAPKYSVRFLGFAILLRLAHRIYCNSETVKKVLLTTGIAADKVEAIPHFSTNYVSFTPAPLGVEVESFLSSRSAVFFSYVCFRKEFELEFFADVIRQFRQHHPDTGFLWVGTPAREMGAMRDFLERQKIADVVLLQGSLEHDVFLTMLIRSLAYIRTAMTDGVCSSVLESLKLKVPVLAADNGTRPAGVRLWRSGNANDLLARMTEVLENRSSIVAAIPDLPLDNNTQKLVDSMEALVASNGFTHRARELRMEN